MKKAPNAWRVGVIAGMASYIDAAAGVGNGIALVIYQFTIGITPGQIGVMAAAMTLCVAIGALGGGRLGDRYGRRRVFVATMAFIVAGCTVLTFATTFPVLLFGVLAVGLGVGADLPVSLATISEAATDRNRSNLIILSNILWGVGIVSSVAIASVAGGWGRLGGQLLYGQVGVVALVVLVLRLSIPESSCWLEARAGQRAGLAIGTPSRTSLRELVRGPYAKPFVGLLLFYGLTNLGANTAGSFNSFIAVNFAGTTVEVFNRWALALLPLGILSSFVLMKFVDTSRRMAVYVIGGVLSVASNVYLTIVGFSLTTMVISMLLAYIGGGLAFEGMMKVWAQESFPTLLRSSASGGIIAAARVAAAMLAAITPALLQASLRGTFLGLAVLTAVGYLIGGLTFRGSTRNEFQLEPIGSPGSAAGDEPAVAAATR